MGETAHDALAFKDGNPASPCGGLEWPGCGRLPSRSAHQSLGGFRQMAAGRGPWPPPGPAPSLRPTGRLWLKTVDPLCQLRRFNPRSISGTTDNAAFFLPDVEEAAPAAPTRLIMEVLRGKRGTSWLAQRQFSQGVKPNGEPSLFHLGSYVATNAADPQSNLPRRDGSDNHVGGQIIKRPPD